MMIVPSGKRKFMKTQQAVPVGSEKRPDVSQTTYVDEKVKQGQPDTQQAEQQMPVNSSAIDGLKNRLDKQVPGQKSNIPDTNAIQQSVDPDGNTDEEIQRNIANIHGFKQSFMQLVVSFGMDTQQITRDRTKRKMMEQMFNIDPTTGKGRIEIPGWYIDPEGNRVEVEYSDAYNKISQMAKKFTFKMLPSRVTLSSDTYAFDVVPLNHGATTPNVARNGLEAVYDPSGGEPAGQTKNKAAFTQSEMIKEGNGDLLDTLIRIGLEKYNDR